MAKFLVMNPFMGETPTDLPQSEFVEAETVEEAARKASGFTVFVEGDTGCEGVVWLTGSSTAVPDEDNVHLAVIPQF